MRQFKPGQLQTGSLYNISASYAVTASYVQNAVSASYALNATSASNAITSSYALTASYLEGYISPFPYTGSAQITGSLGVTGSISSTSGFTGSLQGTASYALNALSASYASYAANGGVTQLLAGPNVTLSPTNGLGQVTVSATLSGSTIFNTATGSYGSFYDTTTQTNPVANVARSMSFNSTEITNGVSISGSTNPVNTYIKTQNAGVYNIQFSAQVDKTDGGEDDIVIWLRKNGIDLTDTATTLTLPKNNNKVVAAWNWFVSSATGDYYQIIWRSADTSLRLLAEPISIEHPGIPSVIVTANRVDQFLSNTGSFSGSFTGLLLGTASNALTASYLNTLNQDLTFNGNLTLNGTASIAYLNVQFESASIIYSSGSNQFGDAANDTQTLWGTVDVKTGPLLVTGSVRSTGGFTGSFSGSVAAPGATTQVVFNNGGVLGANNGFVYSGSRVGIGTEAPLSELQVTDSVTGDAGITIQNSNEGTGNTAAIWFKNASSTSDYRKGAIFYRNDGSGQARGDLYFALNSGASSAVATTADARMVILNSGNVGIRTITPSASLHISGASSAALLEIDSPAINNILFVSGSGQIGFNQTSSTAQATFKSLINSDVSEINTSDNGAYGFRTSGIFKGSSWFLYGSAGYIANASGISILYFDPSRNVGLNVSSSLTSKFQVRGSGATSATTALRVENTNASASLVVLDDGTVGVGTSTPTGSVSLDISGSVRTMNVIPATSGVYDIGSSAVRYRTGWFSSGVIAINVYTNNINFGTTNFGVFNSLGTQLGSWFGTGNLLLQNGGTFTDAGYRLDVSGSARITNGLLVTGGITGSFTGSVAAPGATTQIVFNNGGVLGADSGFVYSGSNVGIGTSSPQSGFKLDVNGQSVLRGPIYTNGPLIEYGASEFRIDTSGVSWLSRTGTLSVGATSSLSAKLGVRGSGATSATTALRVENTNASASLVVLDNGNVGIGTSAPAYKLDVYGNYHQYQAQGLLAQYDISTANANQNRGVWDFYTNAAVSPDFFGRFGFKFEGGTADSFKQFQIHVADSTTPKFIIDGSGRAGLGTITPSSTLDIRGTQTATGAIARTMLISSSLSASANNDVLVGLDITPSFATGAFTGVSRVGLRLNFPSSTFSINDNGTYPTINSNNQISINLNTLPIFYADTTQTQLTGRSNTSVVGIVQGSLFSARFFGTTGNLAIQNGGVNGSAFSDNGYRLQVNATGSDSGSLFISGSSSQPLLVVTSSAATALFVSGSGNVGLGTSTPGQQLTVMGNATFGANTPSAAARLLTRGAGVTSASTSFRAENASQQTALRITDDLSARFDGKVGIGSGNFPTASLDVAGTTRLSGSFNTAISGSILTVQGSGSAQPIFTVQGSQGELFSITDSLSGSLFSVNDISGLPILEVFSDNTTLIGNYQDPMLITTAKVVQTNSGSFTVYSLPTASYDTAFFEYSVRSGSNARAGTIMAMQLGSTVNFTETTTTDFGSTSAVSFTVIVTGSAMALTGSSTSGAWTIKTIVRGL